MPVKNYVFVDRRCPVCHGDGGHPSISRKICPTCHGTGLVGSFEESPDTRIQFHPTQFSRSLRATRERRRISMRMLARHIGVSVSRLSGLENGLGTPTPEEEKKIREWREADDE